MRRIERGDWRVKVVTSTVLTSTAEQFLIAAQLDAYEYDERRGWLRVYAQNWGREIPRRLV